MSDFLTPVEENDLLSFILQLNFGTLQMHGVSAKRRIKQFGWHYAFESYELTPADPIPANFAGIADRAAGLAGIQAFEWAEALVTEYPPGSGIGWHRDRRHLVLLPESRCRGRAACGFRRERAPLESRVPLNCPRARSIF